jgi:hypothetical protein
VLGPMSFVSLPESRRREGPSGGRKSVRRRQGGVEADCLRPPWIPSPDIGSPVGGSSVCGNSVCRSSWILDRGDPGLARWRGRPIARHGIAGKAQGNRQPRQYRQRPHRGRVPSPRWNPHALNPKRGPTVQLGQACSSLCRSLGYPAAIRVRKLHVGQSLPEREGGLAKRDRVGLCAAITSDAFPATSPPGRQRSQVYAGCVNLPARGHPPLRGGIGSSLHGHSAKYVGAQSSSSSSPPAQTPVRCERACCSAVLSSSEASAVARPPPL